LLVVANANAGMLLGEGERCLDLLHDSLCRAFDVRIAKASDAGIEAEVGQGLADGAEVVVAAGGDGTISAVARRLAGTRIPLGILPFGTRNHFARDVLGTADVQRAVEVLRHGHVATIDIGEVNGHTFVNNASIGLYPRIVEERVAQQECAGRAKKHAAIIAGLKSFFRRPLLRTRIHMGGETARRVTPFVFIGNNLYSLELRRAQLRPQLDGGELCIIAARSTSLWYLLRLAVHAWRNQLAASDRLDLWRSESVVVETRRARLSVALDGEIVKLDSPLRFRSLPGALRVIVPMP
jgi:diacylglycerol kinase family enzyme